MHHVPRPGSEKGGGGGGGGVARTTIIMASMEPSKGGYDYEFVTPPPKSLECSICLA